MTQVINFYYDCFADLVSLLDTTVFDLFGFRVSLWSIIFAFIVVAMVANVWWKGAKG